MPDGLADDVDGTGAFIGLDGCMVEAQRGSER